MLRKSVVVGLTCAAAFGLAANAACAKGGPRSVAAVGAANQPGFSRAPIFNPHPGNHDAGFQRGYLRKPVKVLHIQQKVRSHFPADANTAVRIKPNYR
jgi:hypothetical protein